VDMVGVRGVSRQCIVCNHACWERIVCSSVCKTAHQVSGCGCKQGPGSSMYPRHLELRLAQHMPCICLCNPVSPSGSPWSPPPTPW
jgi:hypothetical protein